MCLRFGGSRETLSVQVELSPTTVLVCMSGSVLCARKLGRRMGNYILPGVFYSFLQELSDACTMTGTLGSHILMKKKNVFQRLHKLLQPLFHDLHVQGIGATRCCSSMLSKDDEDRLWFMGVLGVKTPEALLKAIYFLQQMFLILCGGGA